MKISLIATLCLALPLCVFSHDAVPVLGDAQSGHFEHVVWDRIPLSIELPVSTERIIAFPEPIILHNSDKRLSIDKVTIINNNGTLYITAKETFEPIRISATLKSGQVILLDISAKQQADARPVTVLIKSNHASASDSKKRKGAATTISYLTLMRYAVQALYSPDRLIDASHHIARFPMGTNQSVKLLKGSETIDMPLASWSKKGLYITAVLVKNISKYAHRISPSQLTGHWLAFSAYPGNKLGGNAHHHDRTTLFLLSDQPFFTALKSMREY